MLLDQLPSKLDVISGAIDSFDKAAVWDIVQSQDSVTKVGGGEPILLGEDGDTLRSEFDRKLQVFGEGDDDDGDNDDTVIDGRPFEKTCRDTRKTFRKRGKARKCGWIGTKIQRCRLVGVQQKCPQTCRICGMSSEELCAAAVVKNRCKGLICCRWSRRKCSSKEKNKNKVCFIAATSDPPSSEPVVSSFITIFYLPLMVIVRSDEIPMLFNCSPCSIRQSLRHWHQRTIPQLLTLIHQVLGPRPIPLACLPSSPLQIPPSLRHRHQQTLPQLLTLIYQALGHRSIPPACLPLSPLQIPPSLHHRHPPILIVLRRQPNHPACLPPSPLHILPGLLLPSPSHIPPGFLPLFPLHIPPGFLPLSPLHPLWCGGPCSMAQAPHLGGRILGLDGIPMDTRLRLAMVSVPPTTTLALLGSGSAALRCLSIPSIICTLV